MYFAPGWNHYYVIGEHKNAEDMAKDMLLMPMYSYCDFELYALSDAEASMKIYVELMKTAEKMMPGMPK